MTLVEPQVAILLRGARDHGNGHAWLDLRGLDFGGAPAAVSLGFRNGALAQVSWSVNLPGAPSERGWPTREAIDAELAFVRRVLCEEMRLATGPQPWGEVWSAFDAKGFLAANGLRYRPV